jgi:hypothetical protein
MAKYPKQQKIIRKNNSESLKSPKIRTNLLNFGLNV